MQLSFLGTGGGMDHEAALTFGRGGALVVGCGLEVNDPEPTVAAIPAAALAHYVSFAKILSAFEINNIAAVASTCVLL